MYCCYPYQWRFPFWLTMLQLFHWENECPEKPLQKPLVLSQSFLLTSHFFAPEETALVTLLSSKFLAAVGFAHLERTQQMSLGGNHQRQFAVYLQRTARAKPRTVPNPTEQVCISIMAVRGELCCCLCFGNELAIFLHPVLVIEINYLVKLLRRLTHLLVHECSDSPRVYYSK